jgi:hypothetical protein
MPTSARPDPRRSCVWKSSWARFKTIMNRRGEQGCGLADSQRRNRSSGFNPNVHALAACPWRRQCAHILHCGAMCPDSWHCVQTGCLHFHCVCPDIPHELHSLASSSLPACFRFAMMRGLTKETVLDALTRADPPPGVTARQTACLRGGSPVSTQEIQDTPRTLSRPPGKSPSPDIARENPEIPPSARTTLLFGPCRAHSRPQSLLPLHCRGAHPLLRAAVTQ